ncbi:MAG TPA: FHA domain-containing protein [Phycisphaeraceae bacterium]|nr:FHA domain-containing protein [Phycisphaeraceae bacterium]
MNHAEESQQVATPLRLEAVSGPEIALIEVSPRRFTRLGRSAECDFILPDVHVSRQHALIAGRANRWFVSDLHSRSGTYLNGVRLKPNHPTPVEHGDYLRIDPWVFRISLYPGRSRSTITVDDRINPQMSVETLHPFRMRGIAHRRLTLLLDFASRITEISNDNELIEALVNYSLADTGFGRAAIVQTRGSSDEVRILAFRNAVGGETGDLQISSSLLQQASEGNPVRLSNMTRFDPTRSITRLDIHSALCVPLAVDGSILAYLYLDARGRESHVTSDANDYCIALAHLGSLAFSSLKRKEVELRQMELEAQLSQAHEAQQLLLPPARGTVSGLDYAMRIRPGMLVAGDLFIAIPLDEDRAAICIGDVVGEGVGAGMVMAGTQSHLDLALRCSKDAASAVDMVNDYLVRHSSSGCFVSLWTGVFDRRNKTVTIVDAGHGHWFIVSDGKCQIDGTDWSRGIPLGIYDNFDFQEQTIPFTSDQRLILFSDGIVEQRSPMGEEFSRTRVKKLVCGTSDAYHDADTVMNSVLAFACTDSLSDDATIASIQWHE